MFGLGKKTFIGIDIGTSSLKIAEVKIVEGKPQLSNYAWVTLPNVPGKEDVNSTFFNVVLPQFIKKMVTEAKIEGRDAYIAIPAFGGLITLIDLPQLAEEDMEQAIRFEAHKYIPSSLEDVVLSWDVVSNSDRSAKEGSKSDSSAKNQENEKIQILLVAASKNKVIKYDNLVKNSGFKVKAIELESFSLVTSLIGNDPGTFIIVDIGYRVCNLLLVENGIIKVNRNIDAGGRDITRTIAQSMGVDEGRAEKLKMNGKNFFSKDSYIQLPALELISNEVLRMVNAHVENDESIRIDGIILSGGTTNLYGIKDYFSNTLGMRTIIGNPFSRVSYNPGIQPVLDKLASRFSVAIGLALKGADELLLKK